MITDSEQEIKLELMAADEQHVGRWYKVIHPEDDEWNNDKQEQQENKTDE